MRSSRTHRALGFTAALLAASAASAQAQQAQGFDAERLYLSAPGGGWFVMDTLDMHGGLGGVAALTIGYASNPLTVSEGGQKLDVVSNQAFADFGFAATYGRWRLYLNMDAPIVVNGHTGTVEGYSFTGPLLDLSSSPDTLSDARIGLDVRLLGVPGGRFRLGASAQLLIPSGIRPDYVTDGTYRGMLRALVAGDIGWFTYAGQLGVHIRPLDEAAVPGSPQGSELLFGVAGGARVPVGSTGNMSFVIGPEVFGATPFQAFLQGAPSDLEGLLSARFEHSGGGGVGIRARLGVGAGLDPSFGGPQWRILGGVEIFGLASDGASPPKAGQ